MSADTGYAGAGAQDIQILLGSAKECPPNSWRVDSIGPPRPKRGYWIRCVESVPRGATRVWIIVVRQTMKILALTLLAVTACSVPIVSAEDSRLIIPGAAPHIGPDGRTTEAIGLEPLGGVFTALLDVGCTAPGRSEGRR